MAWSHRQQHHQWQSHGLQRMLLPGRQKSSHLHVYSRVVTSFSSQINRQTFRVQGWQPHPLQQGAPARNAAYGKATKMASGKMIDRVMEMGS
jgi:hypothetical protein